MAETDLQAALRDATTAIDNGENPTTALVKAAVARNLTPGRIKIAAQALNSGRQLDSLYGKQGGSRFSTFELVDPEKAIEQVNGKVAETLSAVTEIPTIKVGWAEAVSQKCRRLHNVSAGNSSENNKVAKMATPPKPPVNLAAAASVNQRKVEMERNKKAAEFTQAERNLLVTHKTLIDKAAECDPEHRAAVRDIAVFREGDRVKTAFVHMESAGLRIGRHSSCDFISDNEPLYKAVVSFTNAYEKVAEARESFTAAERAKEAVFSLLPKQADTMSGDPAGMPKVTPPPMPPMPQVAAAPMPAVPGVPKIEPMGKVSGAFLTPMVASLMGAAMGRMGVNELTGDKTKVQTERAKDILFNPAVEEELRQAESEATLHSLMSDPHSPISGHPPAKVIDAFNRLSQSAPGIMQNPLAVEAYLARNLQAPPAPHELTEAAKLNALSVPKLPSNQQTTA